MRVLNSFWVLLVFKLLNLNGRRFIERVFMGFIDCLNRRFCKSSTVRLEPDISQLGDVITTEMTDTEFVTLYHEALAVGYEPQIAVMVATEFKSQEVIDWINEIVGIHLKEPFRV